MAVNDDSAPFAVTDVPVYPEIPTYLNLAGALHIWEGDGWKRESLSWKEGVYVASNLSNMPEIIFSGPNAQDFLSKLSINNVYNWPIGASKHLVMLDDDGYIANQGLAIRDSEDSFRQLATWAWGPYMADVLGVDVDISYNMIFTFQVAGPKSLQVLERLIGEQLRDVNFLGNKRVRIPGIDIEVELSRIGMAQTLAYELRGPMEHSPAVFDAVYRAGQDFGIVRSGWRTYIVNHTEGGFPQIGCTFLPSSRIHDGFMSQPGNAPLLTVPGHRPTGSVDPKDMRARLRTPFETNWGWMAKFDHDFVGRAAIEAEAAHPRRKTVTLVWNKEDVLDVFRSQYEPGEEYLNFEFPTTPQSPAGAHADLVTLGDKVVGVSSLSVYSYYYRDQISHSTIDLEHADIGTEVVVHWGNHGSRIKPIRATVARFPYLDLPTNKDYDLSKVPSGVRV